MKKTRDGQNFSNIIKSPFKLLGWVLQQLLVWTLRLGVIFSALLVILTLFSCVWLGFFIHRNLDRPLTYTPAPVSPQPPEGLTFREFYRGVKGYYDKEFKKQKSPFFQKFGFFLTAGSSIPFIAYQVPRDAWVLTHPESFLSEHIPSNDYQRFVKPLVGKYQTGLRDFPEAMWLQIEASYWYWDHDRFLTYYQAHPEAFQKH